jgi:pimeloyl-ACP methyl ester carboxylesterase
MTPPDAHAPLVLFAHGNSFPGGTYSQLLGALRAQGLHTAALDRFGHDPRYPVTSNWPHLVQQLADFAAPQVAAHAAPVVLVGHSMGGFISLMCAARFPRLGGRGVAGVVLLDSPLLGGWKARVLAAAKGAQVVGALSPGRISRKRRHQWPDEAAVRAHFSGKRAFAAWPAAVLDDYVAHGTEPVATPDGRTQWALRFDRDVETTVYNTLPHHMDRLLRQHPVGCPVGFVGGEQSTECRQVGLQLTRRVVQADRHPERLQQLPGSHLFPLEHPQATARAVVAMLGAFGVMGAAAPPGHCP